MSELEILSSKLHDIYMQEAHRQGRVLHPYKYEDLDPEFVKFVDYVVPGECSIGLASTVVDCSVKPWKIIRQGTVNI